MKVILNYYPGYKRRNAGLKSPNTPTHLEVLRDDGAKVNAELAGVFFGNPSAAKIIYPRPPRSFMPDLLLAFGS